MTDTPLTIDHDEHGDGATVLLRLHGDLDLVTVTELDAALERVDDGPLRQLVVDLRGLRFVDSSGLHALAAADARARQNGHNASFVRGEPLVHRTFELVGLDEHLVFVDDPDELRPPRPVT